MVVFEPWKKVIEKNRMLERTYGMPFFYSVSNSETLFHRFLERTYYVIHPRSENSVLNKGIELFSTMPDGEYRVYTYIFSFCENSYELLFEQNLFFFYKNNNDRGYVFTGSSAISESLFVQKINQSKKDGLKGMIFEKLD
jgi:hypothetical protein